MDKKEQPEQEFPHTTVKKIGRTEYTVRSYYDNKSRNTLFDILLRLMMIELNIED